MFIAARSRRLSWCQFALKASGAVLVAVVVFSESSAQTSFQFLKLPVSSRLAGLGGVNVSLADRDVNFFFANPSLNGDTLAGVASASYQFLAGSGHAAAAYAHRFDKIGMLTFGVHHVNYGKLDGYDESGMPTGQFSAGETALVVGKSHQAGHYRFGASLKGIFSSIAGYGAGAVAVDLGAVFLHPNRRFTVGMAILNAGFVISDFSSDSQSTLPFDVQIGTTFKPQYMPLRFSLTAFNLTEDVLISERNTEEPPTVFDDIFSHLNFGAEILFHRNFNILLGYNYLNHRLLKLDSGGGGAGLSVGLSAMVRDFDIVFSRVGYVAGKASYDFTVSMNIGKYFKKR
jgi:hypothetical protein